jgi:hypothetical protein
MASLPLYVLRGNPRATITTGVAGEAEDATGKGIIH